MVISKMLVLWLPHQKVNELPCLILGNVCIYNIYSVHICVPDAPENEKTGGDVVTEVVTKQVKEYGEQPWNCILRKVFI